MARRETARSYDAYIRLVVDRLHVSATDDEVRAAVLGRMNPDARARRPRLAAAVADRAVKAHHANRDLYSAVMTGRL